MQRLQYNTDKNVIEYDKNLKKNTRISYMYKINYDQN